MAHIEINNPGGGAESIWQTSLIDLAAAGWAAPVRAASVGETLGMQFAMWGGRVTGIRVWIPNGFTFPATVTGKLWMVFWSRSWRVWERSSIPSRKCMASCSQTEPPLRTFVYQTWRGLRRMLWPQLGH